MFLSQIDLNPARQGMHRLGRSPQAMHAAVLACFPPGSDAAGAGDGRVLWRLEQGSSHRATLYVSSPSRPDFTSIVEQAGWPASESTWRTGSLDPLLGRLTRGQQWAFRLTANPTHAVTTPGRDRGRTMAHVTVGQQTDWLLSKAARNGFDIVDGEQGQAQLEVVHREVVRFGRRTDGHHRQVELSRVTFDGILEVNDTEALRQAMISGIGRGKAYGCGLLTLARTP